MAVFMHIPQHTAIKEFINYLTFEKRYSRHTITSYTLDLEQFFTFVHSQYGEIALTKISSSIIRTWMAELKNDTIQSRSINRKLSSLKSFFKYQLKQGTITQSPLTTIVSPKTSKRLPAFVEEKNMDTLFSYVEFGNDWKGKTDKLILQLLYHTGMRLSELIGLKEQHIDFDYKQVKVLGKGNKERIIPVSQELLTNIRQYMAEKPVRLPQVTVLLVNAKGKPLYPKYVYTTVKHYLGAVTTIDKKSPHVLRHTFATHLMNHGADINAVKELLGHASLAATQVYTHNTIEKLKDVYKKAHPKA